MTDEARQRVERLKVMLAQRQACLDASVVDGLVSTQEAEIAALTFAVAAAEAGEQWKRERDEARRFIERWFAARNLPAPEISSLVLGQLEQIEACYPYLKGGETPVECIERHRKDIDALMTLMGQDKTELARLRPLAEAGEWMTWRDIESAPKDGTTVLLTCRQGSTAVMGTGFWHSSSIGGSCWIYRLMANFADESNGVRHPCKLDTPTHWMLLPDPPTLLPAERPAKET